jgi:quercetin 2,3-dioxygenase
MLTIRADRERGAANFGWLDSRHTFSFGRYYDPQQMGFASLRVINEDRVAPGGGFPTHGHENMEIITYVLAGALEHKDSLGTGSVIVQRMSAGTGIRHSEFNASATDPVHLLQIWILPDRDGIAPSYEQKHFPATDRLGKLQLIGSQTGRARSIVIHQDVDLYASTFAVGDTIGHTFAPNRVGWLQVARGSVKLNDRVLNAGDGVAIANEPTISIEGMTSEAEVLLFDLAA